MGYLSKIELKQGLDIRTLANAIPKNAYAEHQAIWRLVGSGEPKARQFLYRREQAGHWPLFYLLSEIEPEPIEGPWDVHTKPFSPKVSGGQRLGFVLRANPVVTTSGSGKPEDKRRVRHDVIMHAKRQEQIREPDPARRMNQHELVQQVGPIWLKDRADQAGFALEALHVDGYRQHRLSKRGQGRPIQFSTLDYQGILRVTDTERFLQSLQTGIGHAKAFGCGLLLIRRV
ncbi:type I-E CRISPR-associated protein Cas6/Cse3/CasE [Thiorhodovibrio frisius]|uniref:CRISPR-associated protein Cas6/Cse3/CasE, subtype I-E n=1 Tax=Thiorhodovibrio frisius TaxID=631362 RepID=H8Z8M6_9GAMM|nr:type I-E CRISPR-associated protein Cas6/Cse3/CasE [Thiorhodovibrio frisius]EIC19431.1 CRISPR-associated protein Cas6/Cse3/CasE, subtype I-E [Thiorhodovibrio frisius]WPL22266.1 CRISPR system Cascade subunit CasE [Thiorhodovibrio frisius]